MKYMNNHFGKSRIFEKPRCKIPMNLQLFAESGDNGGVVEDGEGFSSPDSALEDTPTVEELMTQLAEAEAKVVKLQNKNDTLSSENANQKKQLRAKMSAEEQSKAAEKEAMDILKAENDNFKNKFRIMEYTNEFMEIGMNKQIATELATLTGEIAEPDKFFSALDKFVKAAIKKAGEDSVEALIKSNPSIKAGNGDGTGESLAVRKAKELASGARTANQDILKNYM